MRFALARKGGQYQAAAGPLQGGLNESGSPANTRGRLCGMGKEREPEHERGVDGELQETTLVKRITSETKVFAQGRSLVRPNGETMRLAIMFSAAAWTDTEVTTSDA